MKTKQTETISVTGLATTQDLARPVEMKPNYKRLAADHLKADLGLLLLGESHPKGQLKAHIDHMKNQLVIKYGEASYKRVIILKQVIEKLAEKLAACEDEAQIILTINAIDAINTGRMYIAEEDQLPPD